MWITGIVPRIVLKDADERRLHLSRRAGRQGENKSRKKRNSEMSFEHHQSPSEKFPSIIQSTRQRQN
jgi:hypothetical protein